MRISAVGEILRKILRAIARYSANELKFPVNDRPLFTGKMTPAAARRGGQRYSLLIGSATAVSGLISRGERQPSPIVCLANVPHTRSQK
jgi:hypothetical protein